MNSLITWNNFGKFHIYHWFLCERCNCNKTNSKLFKTILPKNCVQVPRKYIKVCGYSDLFFFCMKKNLEPLDDLWPHICWGHMYDPTQGSLCPSCSHGNTSMYVERVTHFANYHIHTHTTLHTTYRISDHTVSFLTMFRRDKNDNHIEYHQCTYQQMWSWE